jgi:hypothetical protein
VDSENRSCDLDAFAVAARFLESFSVNECTGGIASVSVAGVSW